MPELATAPGTDSRPNPSPLQSAVKPGARAAYRDTILDSAEQVFIRHGVQAAKITEIAAGAGVSVGTLYNTFPSKDELFRSLFERGCEACFRHIEQPFETTDHGERLRLVVRRLFEYMNNNGAAFARFMRHVRNQDVLPEGAPSQRGGSGRPGSSRNGSGSRGQPRLDVNACQGRFARILEALLDKARADASIRTDLEPKWLAHSLLSLADGAINDWLDDMSEPLVPQADRIVTLFLEGALSRENR